MRFSFLIGSAALSLSLISCASVSPITETKKDKVTPSTGTISALETREMATLTVARYGTTGYALKARILVDGEEVGRIKNKQYLSVPIAPGAHEIKLRFNKLSLQKGYEFNLDAKAGETYAYRITSATSGYVGGTTYGNSVSTKFRLVPTTERAAQSCCELIDTP